MSACLLVYVIVFESVILLRNFTPGGGRLDVGVEGQSSNLQLRADNKIVGEREDTDDDNGISNEVLSGMLVFANGTTCFMGHVYKVQHRSRIHET